MDLNGSDNGVLPVEHSICNEGSGKMANKRGPYHRTEQKLLIQALTGHPTDLPNAAYWNDLLRSGAVSLPKRSGHSMAKECRALQDLVRLANNNNHNINNNNNNVAAEQCYQHRRQCAQ